MDEKNVGLISVIIPVYNVENYIGRCLNSIVGQTYRNLEIIAVDDGSRDCSRAICESFAKRDNRVRVIAKENGGVSSARNKGLAAANGEFVAYVDADDYVKPDYFEVLYSEVKKTGADIACCGCELYIDGERELDFNVVSSHRVITEAAEYFFDVTEEKEYYSRMVWGKIIKSEIAKKHSFDTAMKYGEDTMYMFKIFAQSPKTALVDYDGYYYMQTKEGVTGSAGWADPNMKAQHLLLFMYIFDLRENFPEYIKAAVINYYAKHICGAVSVCLKQKTKEAYNLYMPAFRTAVNDIRPYKKQIKRLYRFRAFFFDKTPNLYWFIFHGARRFFYLLKRLKSR